MILSVLICSLHDRAPLLRRLLERLQDQVTPEVEVLTDVDRGQHSIGRKRNDLIARAVGDYVAFIDDDDLVGEDYVARVLTATEARPDCVGLEGIITFAGANPRRFVHSIRYDSWFERDSVYYRCPNHLNPVRRALAVETPFPDISSGEDAAYSRELRPKLQTEVYLEGPLYWYLYAKPLSSGDHVLRRVARQIWRAVKSPAQGRR